MLRTVLSKYKAHLFIAGKLDIGDLCVLEVGWNEESAKYLFVVCLVVYPRIHRDCEIWLGNVIGRK